MAIKLHVIPQEPVKLSLEEQKPIPLSIDLEHLDPFLGDYEVTPSSVSQILQTKGMKMLENVVINPIPSNYGLITWDGHHLTIS